MQKTMPSKGCVVITENASTTTTATQKECKVRLEKLQSKTSSFTTAASTNVAYNMRTRPPKSATSHRTSDRPRPKVDYSRFMVGDEDDTSPPRKQHTVDLKRKPSNSRIASQNYSTKPPTTPRPVRKLQTATITKPASSEETKIAIDALLSLGNDIPLENDITAENSVLMPVDRSNDNTTEVTENQNAKVNDLPIAENLPTPPAPPPAPAQNQQSDSTDEDITKTNNNKVDSTDSQTSNSNTAPANNKRKGTLVTRSFALPRRTRLNRSFKCSVENCNRKFSAVKDLNQPSQGSTSAC